MGPSISTIFVTISPLLERATSSTYTMLVQHYQLKVTESTVQQQHEIVRQEQIYEHKKQGL